MYRFSKFIDTRRADFWRTYYSHPELLSLFAYINSVLAAKIGGYELLSAYDIAEIAEHNPGITKSWETIVLDVPDDDTGIEGTYRYHYLIDASWLSISGFADKRVDPTVLFESGIDFIYRDGVIKSSVRLDGYSTLFITKGQYTSTRLSDYIGKPFGFERVDSKKYRDNMVTLLRLFYDGPTVDNLISAIHVLINSPVAKYDNEVVLSTANGEVLTDKYRYDLGGAELQVQIGDVLSAGQPLAEAVEVYTDKTAPYWWKDRNPELFGKYRPAAVMTYEEVDQLMETFLKYYVAHIRINLRNVDNSKLTYYEDIWNVILDGSTIRSDYIISAYRMDVDALLHGFLYDYKDYDTEEANILKSDGTYDEADFYKAGKDVGPRLRLGGFCVWSTSDYNSEGWHDVNDRVTPKVFPNVVPDDGVNRYWTIGSTRWHILPENKKVKEFWSATETLMPYFEPNTDYWYMRAVDTTTLPTSHKNTVETVNLMSIVNTDSFLSLLIDMDSTATPTNVSSIDSVLFDMTETPKINAVYGDMNIAHAELLSWVMSGEASISAAGIVVHLNSVGEGRSNGIYIGDFPKTVTLTPSLLTPTGTSISVYYLVSQEDQFSNIDTVTWVALPEDGVVSGAYGYLYIRTVLQAAVNTFPTFKGTDISLRV